jgi:uncharacterized protein (DUF2147 family)
VSGERSPTEGCSYIAFADGSVTAANGGAVTEEEKQAVARDMQLGKPNPLASALDGRTLSVGAVLPPAALQAILAGKLSASGVGEIERVSARLTEIRTQGPAKLARFTLSISAGISKGLRAMGTVTLTGQMTLVAPQGALVSLELEGPLQVVAQRRVRPLRRKRTREETKGTFTIKMQVSPTEAMRAERTPPAAEAPRPVPQPEAPVSPLVGKWQTDQPGNVVEISALEGKYVGKLLKSSSSAVPTGTVILRDVRKSGSAWVGKIFVPKHGRVLDAEITIVGQTMEIKVAAGPSTKTLKWTRIP